MNKIEYKGRIIGYIKDDTFMTKKNNEQHLFRKYDALGISIDVLKMLRSKKIEKIVILFTKYDQEIKLNSTVQEFIISDLSWILDGDVQKFVKLSKLESNKHIVETLDKYMGGKTNE